MTQIFPKEASEPGFASGIDKLRLKWYTVGFAILVISAIALLTSQ